MTIEPTVDEPRVTNDVRDQVAGWRRMVLVLAAAFFGLILVVCVYLFLTKRTADHRDAITNCRSKVAAELSGAQVDNDAAFDDLLITLADTTRPPLTDKIARITETERALVVARDARVAFEQHPTARC